MRRQEGVAPVEGGVQRAMAGWQVGRLPAEQGQALVHPRQQRLRLQEPDAGGGQLHRQGQPPPGGGSARRRPPHWPATARRSRPRPGHAPRTVGRRASPPGWRRSRTHARRRAPVRGGPRTRAPGAGGSGSRLVARTVSLGTPASRGVEVCRGGQQVLQVVHHQQDRPRPEERRQRCKRDPAPAARAPHHPGDRRHHQGGIGERRQIDEPDAIGEALGHLLRGGNRQAGLADATGTDQRQQAHVVLGEEAADEGQLVLPVDQPRRLRREMDGDAGRGGGSHGEPSVARRPRC